MPSLADIQTGTILKVDPKMNAGYILRDGDGAYVYFSFDDIEKDVGQRIVQENQRVQFFQEPDASGKPVAKHIMILPGPIAKRQGV